MRTFWLVCVLSLAPPAVAMASDSTAHRAVASSGTRDVAHFGTLTVAEVKAMIDHKEAVNFYDANGFDSYVAGHVPGAQWLQYDAVTSAKLPKSKDAKLVFYCHNPLCGASPHAAKVARSLGYRNVWLMPKGIVGWRDAGMPIVSGAGAK